MELSFRPIAGGYSRQLQLINSSKDSSESFLVQEFSPGEMRRFPVDSCASIPNVSRELLDSGRASWRWQTVKSSPRGSGLSPLAGNLSARLRNRGKVSTMRCLGETVGVAAPVIRSDIEQCIASQAKQHRHHPSVSGTSSPRTHPSRGSSREARPSSQPPKEFLGTRLKKLRNTQKLDLVLAPVRNRGADTLELSFTDHRSGEEIENVHRTETPRHYRPGKPRFQSGMREVEVRVLAAWVDLCRKLTGQQHPVAHEPFLPEEVEEDNVARKILMAKLPQNLNSGKGFGSLFRQG
eukprot:2990405-Rhodomonas_salina.1